MNYRHIYHAGNICDVVKHAVLTLLLKQLRAKEKPFAVLDTHAGIGLYDLTDERAQKTNEAEAGILHFLSAPQITELADYYRAIQILNPDGATRYYPGSPSLIRQMLRQQDRLMACELHDEDVQVLRHYFRNDKQTHIHHRDGYEALTALLPPPENRGLILIDPPFETPDEMAQLVQAIITINQRWPQGQVMIWYPIKERPALWQFHEALVTTGIPKMLCAEFIQQEEKRHDRLNGSGFILINPPYQLDVELKQLFIKLHEALQTAHQGIVIKWLTQN